VTADTRLDFAQVPLFDLIKTAEHFVKRSASSTPIRDL